MKTRVGAQEPDDGRPEELGVWLAAGFDAEEAEVWRGWRFRVGQADAWKAAGVDDGLQAAQWSTAGAGPQTVQAWKDAGIEASEAVRWHEFGIPLEAARAEKQKGHSPEEAFAGSARVQGIQPRSIGVVRNFVTSSGSGGPPGPFGRFHQSGADPRVMHGYMQHQWVDDAAIAWATQGIEALDAYTWHDLGLTALEAGRLVLQGRTPGDVIREWWSAGVPLDEVANWIGAGLSAREAVEQRSRGVTAEQAAALRALRQEDAPVQRAGPPRSALLARLGPPGTERIGPPPEDEEEARTEIGEAFAGMLTRDEESNAILAVDGGSNLGDCLNEAAQRYGIDGQRSTTAVTVNVIRFVNEREARVSYSVVVSGAFNFNSGDRQGRATLVAGEWKVARETFCDFIQVAGVRCPPREV
jgi:hypothetical protein